ncbi:lipid II flippase MurJ, partial [Streptomyces caeruleatus]
IMALVLNVILNILFALVLRWPTWSVALATSISSWVQAIYLFYFLTQGVAFKKFKRFLSSALQIIVLCLICAAASYYLSIVWSAGNHGLLYF